MLPFVSPTPTPHPTLLIWNPAGDGDLSHIPTGDANISSVGVDDLADESEPESRPARFGRVERQQRMRQCFVVHPTTAVFNDERTSAAAAYDANEGAGPLAPRLPGTLDEVDEHQLDLRTIDDRIMRRQRLGDDKRCDMADDIEQIVPPEARFPMGYGALVSQPVVGPFWTASYRGGGSDPSVTAGITCFQ